MTIHGIEDTGPDEIADEISRGGKFVIFSCCVSVIVLTFRRPSDVYFVKAKERAIGPMLRYSFVSLLFGWWGFPWGPFFTIHSLYTNLKGGKNVTADVLRAFRTGTLSPVFRSI